MLNEVDYVLKIQRDIWIRNHTVEYTVNDLMGDKDLLIMPRDKQSKKWDSGHFSTEVYLGKPKTLNKVFSMLMVDRMVLLEIQFSNIIHKLKARKALTYRIVNKIDGSIYSFLDMFTGLG